MILRCFQIPAISTGDIFREHIRRDTESGQAVKAYMDRGELAPDALVAEIAIGRLQEKDCADGFLLDGFPRTTVQAEMLDRYLDGAGLRLDRVILLEVPDETLLDRLTGRRVCADCAASYHVRSMPPRRSGVCDRCGGRLLRRDDDKEETVRRRIEVYAAQTAPLIRYYSEKGLLSAIDGAAGAENVDEEIMKALTRQVVT
jgi:adenylate kinase